MSNQKLIAYRLFLISRLSFACFFGSDLYAESCLRSQEKLIQNRQRFNVATASTLTACKSESQFRRCSKGLWSPWSGSFSSPQCKAIPPSSSKPKPSPIVVVPAQDTLPPTIQELKAPAFVKAGESTKIYFRATDDKSGVASIEGSCWNVVFSQNFEELSEIVTGCNSLTKELELGDGWYSIPLRVGPSVSPGEYVISSLSLTDNSKNTVRYSIKNGEDFYSTVTGTSNLRIFKFFVSHDFQSDNNPPVIHELRAQSDIKAGQSSKIYFRATDDISGIPHIINGCWSIALEKTLEVQAEITAGCGIVSREPTLGEDWYSVPLKVDPSARSGDYVLYSIYLNDQSNNLVQYSAPEGGSFYSTYLGSSQLEVLEFSITP